MTDNILFARYITQNTLRRKLKEIYNMPIECFDDKQINRIKRSIADRLCEVSDDKIVKESIIEAL